MMLTLYFLVALVCSAVCSPQGRFRSAAASARRPINPRQSNQVSNSLEEFQSPRQGKQLDDAADDFQEPFQLSSGAFDFFGNIQLSFSCEGRIYGYYANEALNCQIFHICQPLTHADGTQETIQYNFFCGNQTVFDQSLLVCNHVTDAIPCSESAAFLSRNEEFGVILDY